MDLYQIEMGETIDAPSPKQCGELLYVFGKSSVCASLFDLSALIRSIKQPLFARKIVNRTQNQVESVPIFLYPVQPAFRSDRIIVQLDADEYVDIRILISYPINPVENYSITISVVIGESDAFDPAFPASLDPRLKHFDRIRAQAMGLGMGVVIHFTNHCG